MEIALCDPALSAVQMPGPRHSQHAGLHGVGWVGCARAITQQSHTHSAEYSHSADNNIKVIVH